MEGEPSVSSTFRESQCKARGIDGISVQIRKSITLRHLYATHNPVLFNIITWIGHDFANSNLVQVNDILDNINHLYTFHSGPRLRLLLSSDSDFSAIDLFLLYSYIRLSTSSKHGASKIRWFRTSIAVRVKTTIHNSKVAMEYIAPYTRKNVESSVVYSSTVKLA
jgi:hypothetical protein